jgi:hypothetical protein
MKTQIASGVARGVGRGMLFWFRFGFFSLFLIYLLVHAIALGIANKDITVTILELGKEFLNPLVSSAESLNEFRADNLLISIWSLWGIYFELYKVYLWLKILTKIWGWTPMSNESNKFNNLALAILSFYVIQIIYTSLIYSDAMMSLRATLDIFKGVLQILTNPQFNLDIRQSFVANNTCSDLICQA